MQIPKTIPERRIFIEEKLSKYANTKHYCKAIDSHVAILAKSIKETANWGCLSETATKLCLSIDYVIKNAIVQQTDIHPHSQKQIKKFKFIALAELICQVPKIGTAKLTIGYRKNGNAIEYCITEYIKK